MKRIFDVHPDTGAVETFEHSDDGDTVTIHHREDVTDRLELNKALQTSGNPGWVDKDKSMRHVADIPNGVILEWMTKYGVDIYNKNHLPAVKRLLNSNEFRHLRVNHFII